MVKDAAEAARWEPVAGEVLSLCNEPVAEPSSPPAQERA